MIYDTEIQNGENIYPVTVEYEVYGEFRPATLEDPPEYPEIGISKITVDCEDKQLAQFLADKIESQMSAEDYSELWEDSAEQYSDYVEYDAEEEWERRNDR